MTAATISDTAEICTLINTFDVEPAKQVEVVDSLRRYTQEASRLHGFIAASVHASLDGRRVVNYVQWERREDLAAMLGTDAAKAHLAEVGALAQAVDPVFYRVAFVGARSA